MNEISLIGKIVILRAFSPIYIGYDEPYVEAPKNYHIIDILIIIISKRNNVYEILTKNGIGYVFEQNVSEFYDKRW